MISGDVARSETGTGHLPGRAAPGQVPGRCLALEDSPAGTRAALAAGMTVIQVPDLVHPDEELRALGHRIVGSLVDAHALLLPLLPK